jgi:hypothetical protein
MYTAFILLGLAALNLAASEPCVTNTWGCGGGHPVIIDRDGKEGPDGSMYICQLSAICGGTTYCVLSQDGPYCSPQLGCHVLWPRKTLHIY